MHSSLSLKPNRSDETIKNYVKIVYFNNNIQYLHSFY